MTLKFKINLIMHHLKNDLLSIAVKPIGAELAQINANKNDTEFLWNANDAIWANHAPNLFPVVGGLKDNTYHYEVKSYQLPKHGFIRYNEGIKLVSESENELIFKLSHNEATLKVYPFHFNYYVIYKLNNTQLSITYKVENCDTKPMYFSVGGHPAFKCPIYNDEFYSDYYLEFEQEEQSKSYTLDKPSGLISQNTKAVFDTEKNINLKPDIFRGDALIFKDLQSKKVSLKSKNHGTILSVSFNDYNYLGLWAKPNANFVCIEPWLGLADVVGTNQELKTKEGIISLEANKSFSAQYTIEIDSRHLV